MSAEELRASINRAAGMPPSGESTSAALRRVTAERDEALAALSRLGLALTQARHAIDALKVTAAEARIDADADRSELESARTELALLRRQNVTLRADLTRAQNRAEAAERSRHWIVARDGGRYCERCELEVLRAEAYELEPGTGGLLHHIHCPDLPEEETMPETTGGEGGSNAAVLADASLTAAVRDHTEGAPSA